MNLQLKIFVLVAFLFGNILVSGAQPLEASSEACLDILPKFVEYATAQKARFDPVLISRLEHLKVKTRDLKKKHFINAMLYSLAAGGKRLRPVLVMATARLYGWDERRVNALAIAVEYLHSASLILDDFPWADDASLRRGQKTHHLAFGVALSELSAVSLITDASAMITRLDGEGFDPARINLVQRYCMEAVGARGLSFGQYLDLFEEEENVTARRLSEMTYLKTGLGIETSMVAVALLAAAPEQDIRIWKKFARKLGQAFQIRDDLLDLESSSSESGKDTARDEANGTMTYPKFYGVVGAQAKLAAASRDASRLLEQLPGDTSFFQGLIVYNETRKK